jgi:hypothetical protein
MAPHHTKIRTRIWLRLASVDPGCVVFGFAAALVPLIVALFD